MGGDRSRVVLVVEAAPQFLENLSEQLTNLSYRVVVARSGTEALEKARRLQPCITFLNPVLPQLSGWDVLTLLKSGWETRQIPVVMMSTKVDESQAQHSHADGLIGLPVQLQELQHSLQQWVKAPPSPHHSLTILRLSPVSLATQSASALPSSLNSRLHSHCYQVLEADDLEQADLLVRVWKPIAVLIDRSLENPKAYFQQLSQHPLLAALPLVTLDEKMTQAANQVAGLLVFPCLTRSEVPLPSEETEISALLQAIEVAAGYAWRPSVLLVDGATLLAEGQACISPDRAAQGRTDSEQSGVARQDVLRRFPKESEWLRALNQYLQAAGFRGIIGQSWQEVVLQLQSQSVEVLLLGLDGCNFVSRGDRCFESARAATSQAAYLSAGSSQPHQRC
jgi:CheY-like chemotaxis protein